jgi:hypothetical protein
LETALGRYIAIFTNVTEGEQMVERLLYEVRISVYAGIVIVSRILLVVIASRKT